MKVQLNIENDAELRQHIKGTIKGQVLSIVREEFFEIVKDEIEKKIKGTNNIRFDRLLKEAMIKAIKDILREDCGTTNWRDTYINPIINNIVSGYVDNINWTKLVNDLAKEKITAMLK